MESNRREIFTTKRVVVVVVVDFGVGWCEDENCDGK